MPRRDCRACLLTLLADAPEAILTGLWPISTMARCLFEHKPWHRMQSNGFERRSAFVLALAGSILATSRASAQGVETDKGQGPAANPSFSPEAVEFFESRVRPILADRCVKCHGPKKQSSGLRLDSRESVLRGGESGPAVVPGKPEESLLVQAVSHQHDELKMPPGGKLAEPAIAALGQWIALGAPWPADAPHGTAPGRASPQGAA